MKYTLYENAISSLFIAKKHFVKFYYDSDAKLSESESDEHIKIALIFLENSIELLLKTILSVDEPTCIYEKPQSETIEKANLQSSSTLPLEDILIKQKAFQTIKYSKAIELYIDKYNQSEKLKECLKDLGGKRNAITHFGIDESENYSEVIACFINAFDIIYNYLFPQLIMLNKIGHFFTDEEMYNINIHGEVEPLVNDNGIYNNIVDFLDDLLENAPNYVFNLRRKNHKFQISFFIEILKQVIGNKPFQCFVEKLGAKLCIDDFIEYRCFPSISLTFNEDCCNEILIMQNYSIYLNCSYYNDEYGGLIFAVNHNTNKLYYYKDSLCYYPEHDKPEDENHFNKDLTDGNCIEYSLSMRNLQYILENYIQNIYNVSKRQSKEKRNG